MQVSFEVPGLALTPAVQLKCSHQEMLRKASLSVLHRTGKAGSLPLLPSRNFRVAAKFTPCIWSPSVEIREGVAHVLKLTDGNAFVLFTAGAN